MSDDIQKTRDFLIHVRDGHIPSLKKLIDQGVSPNAKYPNSLSALILASRSANTETMSFLLAQGADASLANNSGNTALHLAFFDSGVKGIGILLEHGANIEAKNIDQETPFLFMVQERLATRAKLSSSHIQTIDPSAGLLFLAQNGADVFVQNSNGKSAADLILASPAFFNSDLLVDIKARVDNKVISASLPQKLHQATPGRKI